MEFVYLGFGLAWDQSPLSTLFLPFRMEMSILRLPYHCILKHVTCLFHRFTSGEEFCFRLNRTLSLIHIYFEWYLVEIQDFRPDAEMNEYFWSCWDGMNVYCMWQEHKFGDNGWNTIDWFVSFPNAYIKALNPSVTGSGDKIFRKPLRLKEVLRVKP